MSDPILWRFGDDPSVLKRLVADGGIVAVPTESSYGLGVDPRSQAGVDAIYALKQREARKPLPIVVANAGQAHDLSLDIDSEAFRFGAQFWPAPLTMLVPVRADAQLALGDLDQVAVRIPSFRPLLALLEELGSGLTATSANLSGEPPLLCHVDVAALLKEAENAAVVVTDDLPGGPPSTVVAWSEGQPQILRSGRFVLPDTTEPGTGP